MLRYEETNEFVADIMRQVPVPVVMSAVARYIALMEDMNAVMILILHMYLSSNTDSQLRANPWLQANETAKWTIEHAIHLPDDPISIHL